VIARTPLKAGRARCLDCAETRTDVRNCRQVDCALHPYRMGTGRVTLRVNRQHCLWRCDGSTHEVKECPAVSCPLHAYRMGHRPISGRPATEAQRSALAKGRLALHEARELDLQPAGALSGVTAP
jgi:hypothetical protein